jgi:acyl carrier protein
MVVMTSESQKPPGKAPEPAETVVLRVMREALETQKLSEPGLDVDEVLAYAIAHPDESVVDSFASVEIVSSLDGVFGKALPREILNHKSLSTFSGLTKSVRVLNARLTARPAAVGRGIGGKNEGQTGKGNFGKTASGS